MAAGGRRLQEQGAAPTCGSCLPGSRCGYASVLSSDVATAALCWPGVWGTVLCHVSSHESPTRSRGELDEPERPKAWRVQVPQDQGGRREPQGESEQQGGPQEGSWNKQGKGPEQPQAARPPGPRPSGKTRRPREEAQACIGVWCVGLRAGVLGVSLSSSAPPACP